MATQQPWLAPLASALLVAMASADLLPMPHMDVHVLYCQDDADCESGAFCKHEHSGKKMCHRPTCADRGGTCRVSTVRLPGSSADERSCPEGEVELVFEDVCDNGCGPAWRCGEPCCAPAKGTEDAAAAPAAPNASLNATGEATPTGGAGNSSANGTGELTAEVVSEVAMPETTLLGHPMPDSKESLGEVLCLVAIAAIALVLHRQSGTASSETRALGELSESDVDGASLLE